MNKSSRIISFFPLLRSGAGVVRSGADVSGAGADVSGAGADVSGNGALSSGNGALSFGNGALSFGNGALSFGNGALSFGNGALSFGNGALSFGNGALTVRNGVRSLGRRAGSSVWMGVRRIAMDFNYSSACYRRAMGVGICICAFMLIPACRFNEKNTANMNEYKEGTFGYDLKFLSRTDAPIVLADADSAAQVVVSSRYQGKVFSSTVDGPDGKSLGYINYKVFDSREANEHIHAYGGENRLWLGPEGGRFSIFFSPGVEQAYDNWHTPRPLDIEPWETVERTASSVTMEKGMEVDNYQGSHFRLKLERTVSLIPVSEIPELADAGVTGKVKSVAYTTENKITNMGDFAWNEETGTVCLWILDMFNVAPGAVTLVPYIGGSEEALGRIVTSDYFGEIPPDRLRIIEGRKGVVALKTDGGFRSKIGLSAGRAGSVAGNYDPDARHLVLAFFDVDPSAVYLNQEWNPDRNPLVGDVLNAYNDGPLEDGSIMGPFLELESSSPAAFLAPGETLAHRHSIVHLIGEDAALSAVTERVFGLSIKKIKSIF
ncbi:MAG: hypothetical protein LBH04_04700 [Tannerellaceae bacterium]|jgi:hypothetical protein|nr:hypothetical protein [Tannerellaceae bacterium]